ncbi:MAG TPA: glycosyltransferase family 2 protein [Flavobacteriales bacterium]|nr:glycosyltransferase family 2 protein [Flavobacteriales bacterium]
MEKQEKISVVIPVYNSAGSLVELIDRIHATLSQLNYRYEVLMVDDCSKDNSWEIILQLKEKYPQHIKGVQLGKNAGQHMAIICGLNLTDGDLIVTMDDDLQHPPEEIPKLLTKWEETGYDVVYGLYNTSKGHGKARGMASNFVKKTSTKFSDNSFGNGSSFRLLSRKLIDKLIRYPQQFVFIDEIIYWYTTKVTGVQVRHEPRKAGKSNYNWFKLFRLYLHIVVHFTALPLQLMVWGGLIFSIISFLLGVFFIVKKMVSGVSVEGYTSLMVVITFSTSLMLVCFGTIGRYIYQVHQNQNGKPPYTIREII